MCTRFFIEKSNPVLSRFGQRAQRSRLWNEFMQKDASALITSGEIKPTNLVAVLAPNANGRKAVYPMKWGYKLEHTMLFNARSETAGSKPTFREDWNRHRCIIPCSYYFEWEHIKNSVGDIKTGEKYVIKPAGKNITWLCGLYRITNGLPYFVVLTRPASDDMMKIHERMPLILPEHQVDAWLNPGSNPDTMKGYALTDLVAEKYLEETDNAQTAFNWL